MMPGALQHSSSEQALEFLSDHVLQQVLLHISLTLVPVAVAGQQRRLMQSARATPFLSQLPYTAQGPRLQASSGSQ